jgi:hypothetical protein
MSLADWAGKRIQVRQRLRAAKIYAPPVPFGGYLLPVARSWSQYTSGLFGDGGLKARCQSGLWFAFVLLSSHFLISE